MKRSKDLGAPDPDDPRTADLFAAIAVHEVDSEAAISGGGGGGDHSPLIDQLRADPGLASRRNEQGVSAIMFALYHRKRDLARIMLDAGHAPDAFESAALGLEDRLTSMLDRDAGLVAESAADGFTLLHLACFFDQPACVSLLIDRGAPLDAIAGNPSRVAPIHSAAACGSTSIVRRLLEASSAADLAQHGGFTALMSAALHGNRDMAQALLDHGASPTRTADDDRTPITMARESGHESLAVMLESHAAT